jgi:hypothetical protein
MHWSGDRATLTLTHLNKEDEGLYTLRVTTKSGYETYSAYVFVRGEQSRPPPKTKPPSCPPPHGAADTGGEQGIQY